MKKIFLFCTKIGFFLTEIPPVALLALAIIYNGDMENPMRLYPMMLLSAAAILLIFLYFFRMIAISKEEIRSVGVFSSRDFATIDKGKVLVLTTEKRSRLAVSLECLSDRPTFSWESGGKIAPRMITLYSEKAVGGIRAARKVLRYFDIEESDVAALLREEQFEASYDYFNVGAQCLDGKRTIRIEFTKTI